jgi:hypothetical protein
MARWLWTIAFLTCALDSVQAQSLAFPPFVRSRDQGNQLFVPQCRLAGATMNCQLLTLTVMPLPSGEPGTCYVQMLTQEVVFRRESPDTWVGSHTIVYCRIKNIYRLQWSPGPPRRVALRVTYELGEKSEACLKADREFRETEWKEGIADVEWAEGDPNKPLSIPIAGCKSFVTGPGQFPARAFQR